MYLCDFFPIMLKWFLIFIFTFEIFIFNLSKCPSQLQIHFLNFSKFMTYSQPLWILSNEHFVIVHTFLLLLRFLFLVSQPQDRIVSWLIPFCLQLFLHLAWLLQAFLILTFLFAEEDLYFFFILTLLTSPHSII